MLFEENPEEDDLQRLQQEETRLREEMTAATTRMLRSEQEVRQLQDEISAIPAVGAELREAQQRLTEQRETVKLLDTTMEFLQQARENLSTAYMGTIRSRFGYYLSKLEGGDGKYLVDSQLRVQLERQGQSRELAYFSAGQTDLVLLCVRLALVDALFKNEEMFVILDDPFVNLDDEHMEQARRLLQELASQRQILYLTCNSSRTL
jgi:DNA repair exonuclease SbcCD ATPase subunit